MSRQRLALLVIAATLAGCGGTPEQERGFCEVLSEIRTMADEFSEEFNRIISDVRGSPDLANTEEERVKLAQTALADLDERFVSVPDLYEEASRLAPTEDLAAAVDQVRSSTVLILDAMSTAVDDASSIAAMREDFQAVLQAPGMQEAAIAGGAASRALDEHSVPECGFRFSDA